MEPCYQFGYLAETSGTLLGVFVMTDAAANVGPLNEITLMELDERTIFATNADLTFVMRKFLNPDKRVTAKRTG